MRGGKGEEGDGGMMKMWQWRAGRKLDDWASELGVPAQSQSVTEHCKADRQIRDRLLTNRTGYLGMAIPACRLNVVSGGSYFHPCRRPFSGSAVFAVAGLARKGNCPSQPHLRAPLNPATTAETHLVCMLLIV